MQSRDELPECICWANMVKLFVGSRGTMQMFDSVLNLQLNLLVDVVKGNFNRLPLRTVDFHSFGEGPKMLLLDASLPLSPALPSILY